LNSTILFGQTKRRINNSELGFGKSKLGIINNSKLRVGIWIINLFTH